MDFALSNNAKRKETRSKPSRTEDKNYKKKLNPKFDELELKF